MSRVYRRRKPSPNPSPPAAAFTFLQALCAEKEPYSPVAFELASRPTKHRGRDNLLDLGSRAWRSGSLSSSLRENGPMTLGLLMWSIPAALFVLGFLLVAH
jgi:hypothetical protein